MSIDAAVARIQEIVAEQQQLSGTRSVSGSPAASAGAVGAGSGVSSAPAASFADTLARAQSSPATAGTAMAATAPASGVVVPQASWNPERKPIAAWIAPILQWASEHGWTGTVTSGYRTYSEQAALNAAGAYSAPAGKSNHETSAYPGGAVDVTDPGQLISVLGGYTGPLKLVGGVLGSVDPEHFSANGH